MSEIKNDKKMIKTQKMHINQTKKMLFFWCVFPGALPVWRKPGKVLFSQDASGRLLVPQTVSALEGVPAPSLQIPHQEIQVWGCFNSSITTVIHDDFFFFAFFFEHIFFSLIYWYYVVYKYPLLLFRQKSTDGQGCFYYCYLYLTLKKPR